MIPGLSEDYSFCWRCKEMGVPVLLAPQVECHHLITVPLYTSDYAPSPESVKPARATEGKLICMKS